MAKGGFRDTSPVDKKYNCIAYAAGDLAHWWWPFPMNVPEVYWPPGVAREESLDAFRAVFVRLGYVECARDELETGFEKIALFVDEHGIPSHAARQQSNGRWISKLGEREDIEHDLRDLEGAAYGTVAITMKRPTIV